MVELPLYHVPTSPPGRGGSKKKSYIYLGLAVAVAVLVEQQQRRLSEQLRAAETVRSSSFGCTGEQQQQEQR